MIMVLIYSSCMEGKNPKGTLNYSCRICSKIMEIIIKVLLYSHENCFIISELLTLEMEESIVCSENVKRNFTPKQDIFQEIR